MTTTTHRPIIATKFATEPPKQFHPIFGKVQVGYMVHDNETHRFIAVDLAWGVN